jgi:hypothetical protein
MLTILDVRTKQEEGIISLSLSLSASFSYSSTKDFFSELSESLSNLIFDLFLMIFFEGFLAMPELWHILELLVQLSESAFLLLTHFFFGFS